MKKVMQQDYSRTCCFSEYSNDNIINISVDLVNHKLYKPVSIYISGNRCI